MRRYTDFSLTSLQSSHKLSLSAAKSPQRPTIAATKASRLAWQSAKRASCCLLLFGAAFFYAANINVEAAQAGETSIATKSAPPAEQLKAPVHQAHYAHMETGTAIPPPIGFVEFCAREPKDCQAPVSRRPNTISRSNPQSQWLDKINRYVNHTIAPVEDKVQYGRSELWTLPITAGDCEDYALLKRKMLIEKGLPADKLLLAIAFTPTGEAHTMLVAITEDGDFVLDNRTDAIYAWQATPYRWFMRQSPKNQLDWVTIVQTPKGKSASG